MDFTNIDIRYCYNCGCKTTNLGDSSYDWSVEYECGCMLSGIVDEESFDIKIEIIKQCPKMKTIDPPNGSRYGFPKQLPNDVVDVRNWLIENGYPKSEIESLGEYFHYKLY